MVSSIAERTLPDGEPKDVLIGRFHALGHTHDLLSNAGWTEAALRDVILTRLAPHTRRRQRERRGKRAACDAETASRLAPGTRRARACNQCGEVRGPLGFRRSDQRGLDRSGHNPPRLELTWREQGGPRIEHLSKHGFGTELIERGIRFELHGEAKLELANGGLLCRIIIPADPRYVSVSSLPDKSAREEAAS